MRTSSGRITSGMVVLGLLLSGCSSADETATASEDPATSATDDATDGPELAVYDPNAAPAEDWEARDPRLPEAPQGEVHELTLRASQFEGEVAGGVVQQLWSFDNQVPGPTLRAKVGDTFVVTFVNDGEMGHSIDFHASKVAPSDEMRTIQPGEELTYEFEAKHAGIWMYHCGTAPVLLHTGNGQYGAVVIDPPDLAEVDHEYIFVQSEFYLGAQGSYGDHGKMQDEAWDIVAFNGYANQYAHAPITDVAVGERVRIWLLNAGPSENSSFHVIGTIFDTVYKEGAYRLHPDREQAGGAQALDLQPSQGGFVEFTFDEDGVYPFVTHKFANVERGAVGLFHIGDIDQNAGH
jgi:nitrite reductase (NO-forming)